MKESMVLALVFVIGIGVGFVVAGFTAGTEYKTYHELTSGLNPKAKGEELVPAMTVVKFKDGKVVDIEPFKEVR